MTDKKRTLPDSFHRVFGETQLTVGLLTPVAVSYTHLTLPTSDLV